MPKVFIVDPDCDSALQLVDMVERNDSSARYATTLEEAMAELKQNSTDLLLLDTSVPDGSVIDFLLALTPRKAKRVILCGPDNGLAQVIKETDSKLVGFEAKPLTEKSIRDLLLNSRRKIKRKKRRGTATTQAVEDSGLDELLVGESQAIKQVRQLVLKVAPTEATVLIVGDSGTGKELVAQGIHATSNRSDKPFEAINCGAIAENLLESELFGHMKGAFTGADRNRAGIFERANCGTLFLDEVTEMAPEMQVRLLRVLETMTLRRVGGEKEISVDVRVIAATNRNLEQAVREGKLREDLMYRLAVFQIDISPLRERGEDVVLLAEQFLGELNAVNGTAKSLSDTAIERLRQYHWPGNVRQLRNVVNRGYILAKDNIDLTYLAKLIHRAEAAPSPNVDESAVDPDNGIGNGNANGKSKNESAAATHAGSEDDNDDQVVLEVGTSIEDAERELIEKTLDEYDGDKKKAAEVLGISLKTLYNRLNEYEEANDDDAETSIPTDKPGKSKGTKKKVGAGKSAGGKSKSYAIEEDE